jgi:hypothetical protein
MSFFSMPLRLVRALPLGALVGLTAFGSSGLANPVTSLERASHLLRQEQARDAAEEAGEIEKSNPAIETLRLQRFYRVGDRWRVWHAPRKETQHERRERNSTALPEYARPLAYDFEVVQVGRYTARNGSERKTAEIRVTIADPRLAASLRASNAPTRLTLVINDLFRGIYKVYHHPRVRPDGLQDITVSLDGRRNITAALDRFPIELPNVSRAHGYPTLDAPYLPPSLRTALGRDFSIDLAASTSFRYRNHLGKRLEVIWTRQGLWPAYVASESGITVLVSEQRSSR